MSDIPSDVLRDLLLRLPAESLFRFRTVCKEWRCIIDDPSFVRSHTDNQQSSSTLLIRSQAGTPVYYLNLDSLNYSDGYQYIDVIRVKTLVCKDVPRLPVLPASCHGLVLITHYSRKKIWAIWNPLTREFRDLPESNSNGNWIGSGLGYDSAADDYKAVRIEEVARTDESEFVYQTHVYSLKLDSWKMIKDCPNDFPDGADVGVFLNGVLHWRSWDRILALNLSTEDYYEVPLPPQNLAFSPDIHFDAMGGSLVMNCSRAIWLLDSGDRMWTKLFSYEHLCIGGDLRPIAYLESKGQVILQEQWSCRIYWLDMEKNTAKIVSIYELKNSFTCQICPGSLVRLPCSCDVSRKEVEISGGTKRKRSQRKSDRRLEWSVRVGDSSAYGYVEGRGRIVHGNYGCCLFKEALGTFCQCTFSPWV